MVSVAETQISVMPAKAGRKNKAAPSCQPSLWHDTTNEKESNF